MAAHIHAKLMMQYAKDAMETDRPWERWEFTQGGAWRPCENNPGWFADENYRRKPEMIKVGKWEFLKPIEQPLGYADAYYYVTFSMKTAEFTPFSDTWCNDRDDKDRLAGNLCHLSREAAQAHADALNAICRGDVE